MRKSKKITHHYKKILKKILSHQKSKLKNNLPTYSQNHPTPKRVKAELDRSDVIEGMALFIQDYILRYNQLYKPRYHSNFPGPRIFNSTEYSKVPEITQIQYFIQKIFYARRLHVESGIIALILLNRTGIIIHSQNWMRLLLISLLLANKHCEDVYSVYNAKFVGLIPNVENLEINILELEFLKYLKYRLHIETKTYEEYYAKLQNFFPIEEEDNRSNTEETDSIEEEVYSSTLDYSTSSLDNVDQNSRKNKSDTEVSNKSLAHSQDSSKFHLPKPDTENSTGYADLKPTKSNLWRDFHFAKTLHWRKLCMSKK